MCPGKSFKDLRSAFEDLYEPKLLEVPYRFSYADSLCYIEPVDACRTVRTCNVYSDCMDCIRLVQ